MACAWVTGASRGIGRAIALALAQAGYDIVITYRQATTLALDVAKEITNLGKQAHVVQLDITVANVGDTVQFLLDTHGCPDVLVNNAGVTHSGLFAAMTQQTWDTVVTTNLVGYFAITRPVVRQMLRRREGRIVNIASVAGQRGNAGQVPYAASKAGIIGATKALALEIASRNVTVNAVAPGLIDTDMTGSLNREALIEAIPMGRFGTPQDVAGVVAFLCSKEAAYITGQVIGVNGGLYT